MSKKASLLFLSLGLIASFNAFTMEDSKITRCFYKFDSLEHYNIFIENYYSQLKPKNVVISSNKHHQSLVLRGTRAAISEFTKELNEKVSEISIKEKFLFIAPEYNDFFARYIAKYLGGRCLVENIYPKGNKHSIYKREQEIFKAAPGMVCIRLIASAVGSQERELTFSDDSAFLDSLEFLSIELPYSLRYDNLLKSIEFASLVFCAFKGEALLAIKAFRREDLVTLISRMHYPNAKEFLTANRKCQYSLISILPDELVCIILEQLIHL